MLGASGAGCAAEFDPASEVTGLRVLAVKKSAPYARPGEAVDLTMLWHDAEPGRPLPQIAWVALCENPPADLFEACFTQLPDLPQDQIEARISIPDPTSSVPNDRFRFTTSDDLISSRPPPPEASSTAYGLSYVFFAACAGELAVDMGSQVPFVCYEELDGIEGFGDGDTRRDSRDFVVGYSAVFAYDEFRNQNPIISGVQFGDATLWPDSPPDVAAAAPPEAVLAPARDLCIGADCGLIQPDTDVEPCLDVLTLDTCIDGSCDSLSVRPLIDAASAEIDEAASGRGSDTLGEQMWINYYASAGELSEEVRLLNDAIEGFSTDTATEYEPADAAQVSYLWTVAHDNRGGAEWARLRVCTR
jgi:hypothetical protein